MLSDRASVSPYAGVSTNLASAHEKSVAVTLDDEDVVGVQGTLGAALHLRSVRLAADYNSRR
jgi:hypothetical protein